MELTAIELWALSAAVAAWAPHSVGEIALACKLLPELEFTEEERAAIGWRAVARADGAVVPLFQESAPVTRQFNDKRVSQLLNILREGIRSGIFRGQHAPFLYSLLVKLGWVPVEDDE